MVIEKASIDAEVARLSRLRSQHSETQFRLRAQIRHLGEERPRLEKRLEEVRSDLGKRQDTRADQFAIHLDGAEVRDRGIAGELLLRQAERMKGSRAERQVGCFAGFSLWVADNFMAGPEIVIKGAGTHLAKVSNTALGTMRSVEYAIQNLEEVAASIEQRIAETRKRIADLIAQSEHPFEYEDRLVSLVQRQRDIEEALDLTKSQASSQLAADPSGGAENEVTQESR
jgi:TolA-binding protein